MRADREGRHSPGAPWPRMTLLMMDFDKAKALVMGAEDDADLALRNFGALPRELSDLETARVAILPIPYDLTASYRSGSRMGPRAIIEASHNMELYDEELDDIPARLGIHTLSELEVGGYGPERMVEITEETVSGLLGAGKIVCSLGGEHTITSGTVRAYAKAFPDLSVLCLDAHADLRDAYQGVRYSHACAMRRVREIVGRVSHIGVRSLSVGEAEHAKSEGIVLHEAASWTGSGEQLERILEELGSGPVYVTCDLDVFDPAYVPSTGTPEPGGLSWNEVTDILREVAAEREIVGFDAVELAPISGFAASDFLAAKLVYKMIGYVLRREAGSGKEGPRARRKAGGSRS